MADLREKMAAQAVAPSMETGEVFKFTQPGETVCGRVVVAKFDIDTKFGSADLVEVDDDKRGQVTVWISQAQLRAGLLDGKNQTGRRIAVGDLVYIRFDGITNLDGGKTVKNFSIAVEAGEGGTQDRGPAPEQAPSNPVAVPIGGDSPF